MFVIDVAEALVGVGLICNSETNPGVLALDKDYQNISKFLNRILGMPVDLQNRLFQYFTDTLAAIVITAKKSGRYDLGILDLGTEEAKIHRTRLYTFMTKHPTGTGKIELHSFDVERGMSWEEAKAKWSLLFGTHEGFYISNDVSLIIFQSFSAYFQYIILFLLNVEPVFEREAYTDTRRSGHGSPPWS